MKKLINKNKQDDEFQRTVTLDMKKLNQSSYELNKSVKEIVFKENKATTFILSETTKFYSDIKKVKKKYKKIFNLIVDEKLIIDICNTFTNEMFLLKKKGKYYLEDNNEDRVGLEVL